MQVLAAGAALVATALGYDILLATLRKADRGGPNHPGANRTESTWWFGYARDLVNLSGMIGISLSFLFLGLRAPLALLAGGLMTVLTYVLDYAFGRLWSLRPAALALAGVVVGLALAEIVFRERIATSLSAFLGVLFPVRA